MGAPVRCKGAMKVFPVLLIAIGLAATACSGAATVSGSNVNSATKVVRPYLVPNADQDISDLGNRPNPPIHKSGGPVPTRIQPPSAPATRTPAILRDRCMNETGRPGKPQPMCLPA